MFKRNLALNVSIVLTILFAALTIAMAIMLLISLLALFTGDMGLMETANIFGCTMVFALWTAAAKAATDTIQEMEGAHSDE